MATSEVPREAGVVRLACSAPLQLPSGCVLRFAGEAYGLDELEVSGAALALRVRGALQAGAQYTVEAAECGLTVSGSVRAVASRRAGG